MVAPGPDFQALHEGASPLPLPLTYGSFLSCCGVSDDPQLFIVLNVSRVTVAESSHAEKISLECIRVGQAVGTVRGHLSPDPA